MNRPAWTLHEMLISLCVMSSVFALVAHHASGQLRLIAGLQRVVSDREHMAQTGAIAERVLWGVSPAAGDVLAAHDSALEVRMQVGTAAVCASSPGRIVVPAPSSARGSVLGAFSDTPEPGDIVAAFFQDSAGATWLNLHLSEAPVVDACPRFPEVHAAWMLALSEPLVVPPGAAVRFLRPLRMSLYRASDSRWFLGARDWNGEQQRFNTIQPVVGPLRPYSTDAARTGLLFRYGDANGLELSTPFDASRLATITIVTRTRTDPAYGGAARVEDSASVTVALRNGQ